MIQADQWATGPSAPIRPAQVRERFKDAVLTRMRPLLDELQASVEAELQVANKTKDAAPGLADDVTNLAILRAHSLMYETRWKAHLAATFDAWPQPPAAEVDQYALLSEDELQSQLVGQPVIDGLDHRFSEILDVIDSRLWDFSMRSSGRGDTVNPVSPRVFVEGLLRVFPRSECSATLRAMLLRHYQHAAGAQLGDFYAWFNTELAEAGFAMTRPGRYASEVASSVSTRVDSRVHAVVGGPPAGIATRRTGVAGVLSQALRLTSRGQRERAPACAAGRELGSQEFLAVLSLVQADGHAGPPAVPAANLVPSVRGALINGAANLGLDPGLTMMSAEQDDAIDLVGMLLGALIDEHDFSQSASQVMADLAFPYVRLVLSDPDLFDDGQDPAMQLLAELTVLWDGAQADGKMHALGLAAARRVINQYHGETRVFGMVLDELRDQLQPLRLRADVATRRAWQTMAGRERLQAARQEADAAARGLLAQQCLLPTVSLFLTDVWRQALVHAWLRQDSEPDRYRCVRGVGDSLVQADVDAAIGAGRAVAQRMLALEPSLRDCYRACGLDDAAADTLIAGLVAEIARPDAPRGQATFEPIAADVACSTDDGCSSAGHAGVDGHATSLRVDQAVIVRENRCGPEMMRVAGISPLSGRCLLVAAQGGQLVLDAAQVRQRIADGSLVARDAGNPVETIVHRLAREAGDTNY